MTTTANTMSNHQAQDNANQYVPHKGYVKFSPFRRQIPNVVEKSKSDLALYFILEWLAAGWSALDRVVTGQCPI